MCLTPTPLQQLSQAIRNVFIFNLSGLTREQKKDSSGPQIGIKGQADRDKLSGPQGLSRVPIMIRQRMDARKTGMLAAAERLAEKTLTTTCFLISLYDTFIHVHVCGYMCMSFACIWCNYPCTQTCLSMFVCPFVCVRLTRCVAAVCRE